MKRIVIIWGLIGGGIISTFMAISMLSMADNTDFENAELYGYTAQVVALSAIFIGVKTYRDKQLNGSITFGKAFLTGLYIALIAATMYVVTWMILSECCLQDFAANYFQSEIEKVQSSGLSEEEIALQIQDMEDMMEMYNKPIFKFFFTYIEILPLGIIISLISAAILRKKVADPN
ncbi:MAG: DUF4199 domain-containing protein [Bacteroidota bacterium]